MTGIADMTRTVPLSGPDITEADILAVVNVLRTSKLSLGPKLEEFEEKFAAYTGARYAVAVSSGTAGLHLAVKSLGLGENDAVITTPFSFIASSNCLLYENVLPVFIDIEAQTFNIDTAKVEEFLRRQCRREPGTGLPLDPATGRRIRAILPVHVFGHPCDMTAIGKLAEEFGLSIIEDACEALGASTPGGKAGTLGDIGVFAFYPNKQMTTGEGGMILTGDAELAALCRSFRNQGRDTRNGWLDHCRLGYNYRLSDINCALGISQLERINHILWKREKVAEYYTAALGDIVETPVTMPGSRRSWFVYIVALPAEREGERDAILAELTRRGIGCNNYFPPIHLQSFYRTRFGYHEGMFPVTEAVAGRTIALPFHSNSSLDDISYVSRTLKELLQDRWNAGPDSTGNRT